MKTEYKQIGVAALRSPDGEFLPSVPVFKKCGRKEKASEFDDGTDLARLLASKMKQYQDGLNEAGLKVGD